MRRILIHLLDALLNTGEAIFGIYTPPPTLSMKARRGYHFAAGACAFVWRLFVAVWLVVFLFRLCGFFSDDSDEGWFKTSGVRVITDAKTGVQYLYRSGAITPRLNPDGSIVTKPSEK